MKKFVHTFQVVNVAMIDIPSKLKAYIEYFLALCTLFISEEFGQTSLFLDIAVKSIKLIVSLNTL